MITKLDTAVLGLFQRVSHWIQKKIGFNNFFLTKIFLLFTILALSASYVCKHIIQKAVLFDLVIVILFAGLCLITHRDIELFESKKTRQLPLRKPGDLLIRKLYLFLSLVTAISYLMKFFSDSPERNFFEVYADGLSDAFVLFFMCALYFGGCTPKEVDVEQEE